MDNTGKYRYRRYVFIIHCVAMALTVWGFFAPPLALSWDQFVVHPERVHNYNWTLGCSPTSAAMALSYHDYDVSPYDLKCYGNLIRWYREQYEPITGKTNNVPPLIDVLAYAMDTNNEGSTSAYHINDGIMFATNDYAGYNYLSRRVEDGGSGEGSDWCWDLIRQE